MKRVSKLVLGVCLAIGLAIAFTGCATNKDGTYKVTVSNYYRDKSVPWQEQALIMPIAPRNGSVGTVNVVNASNRTILACQADVGVIPAGTHTLYVYLMGYTNALIQSTRYETTTPIQISYDFQPGGRYVLIGSVKKKLFTADYTVEIKTLDEYYALPDESPGDKKMKNEHVPKIFAQIEAQLNSESQ
ncbi:MAG: hypothetical protein LBU85_06180 [Treponema sp.]|nr:hypothetical protein [Treponema sp.]